jgi:hypothetical protein
MAEEYKRQTPDTELVSSYKTKQLVSMAEEYKRQTPDTEEPPPFFKHWKGWYAVVLINLLALTNFIGLLSLASCQ